MGRKQAQTLLAALIASPVAAQDNLLVNGGFQQGLSGWYETGPGSVYDGCGPAGGYCYVFSYATGVVQQTVTTQANYTGFIVGFEYRLPCNNSIGGYCTNPNGPVDWLTANLNLYLGDTQVQSVPLLSVQSYQPNYAVFSLTGTAPEFNTATITFSGQDVGFWAGPYGPQIDRVSLSFENPPPPPPPPPPEPEPEPVVVPPASIDPAPDVAPDPTQAAEEAVQDEPAQEVIAEEPVAEVVTEAAQEADTEEVAVSDDVPEQQDENQAEDANDEPLSPDQLQALSAIEASNAPSDEEFEQAIEAVADASAEAVKASEANPTTETIGEQDQTARTNDVQPEDEINSSGPDQQASETPSQQEAPSQPDLASDQPVQQETTQDIQIDVQQSTQPDVSQKTTTPPLELVDTNQSQVSENVTVSSSPQEQGAVVIEQGAIEAGQSLQTPQQDQAKEPETITSKLIADAVTQVETAKTEIPEAVQSGELEKSGSDAEFKEPEKAIDSVDAGQPKEPEREIITSFEGYQDINTAFFNKEAIEDADTFQRERVIPVSVQDVGIVASANAELAQTIGEQTTTETPAGTYDILIVDGPTFMPTPTTGMGDMTSPVGQAQQMELLGMNGMQSEMAAGQPTDIGDVNSGDGETMTQLASVPAGYSSYTQARIPDVPFYQPKDIYKGRRIPDANLALYRMMQGQDQRWNEMVEDQYE